MVEAARGETPACFSPSGAHHTGTARQMDWAKVEPLTTRVRTVLDGTAQATRLCAMKAATEKKKSPWQMAEAGPPTPMGA